MKSETKRNMLILILGVCLALPVGTAVANYVSDLNTAKTNWNSIYGTNVRITGWTDLGIIQNQAQRESTVTQMTDSSQVYVVSGDPTNPPTITAVLMDGQPQEILQQWRTVVGGIVAIGQHKIKISWKFVATQDSFTTIAVANDDSVNGIKFDAMLATIVTIESERTAGGGKIMKWIWGSTRGRIHWEVTCHDTPPVCTHDCYAWISLGDAQIQCIEEIVGNNCKLYYGWAYRSPTGSITIVWNPTTYKFEITITGLGSSGKGDGSVIDPCPSEPDSVPTLTQWGLIILVALLVFSTWVVLKRRRKTVGNYQ
jgi:hypothetical protein